MTQASKLEALIQKAIENGFYSFADGMFGDPEVVVIGGNNPE